VQPSVGSVDIDTDSSLMVNSGVDGTIRLHDSMETTYVTLPSLHRWEPTICTTGNPMGHRRWTSYQIEQQGTILVP